MSLRFQFGTRNLLWATLWVAVWAAALSILRSYLHHDPPLPETHVVFYLSLLFAFFSTPFVAVGALFSRTKAGLVVGGIIAIACIVMLYSRR
jgi:hypothetical protein